MYQLINGIAEPYTLLLLSLLAALVWLWRDMRPRRMVLEIAIGLMVLLCLLSTLIVGHLAIGSLEWSYPPSVVLPTRADTIVVLAGNIDMIDQEGIKVRIGGETLF